MKPSDSTNSILRRHRIAEAMNDAILVRYFDSHGQFVTWYGGHTVHVFAYETGKEVDCWNIGDFSRRPEDVTVEEVLESVRQRYTDDEES